MKIPSERLLKEPEVGKTFKRWECPDPVKNLTRTTAVWKSGKSNVKINFLCSYKWLYLKDCVFEWVWWWGCVGEQEGVWKLKKYKNAELLTRASGILLDLMKTPKVSKSLK